MHFVYVNDLRKQWKSGEQPRTWMQKYPQLFVAKDISLTRKGSSYIFFEWLAAILLYEATGYLSYHKYDCKNHYEKNRLFHRVAPELVSEIEGESGTPDLLAVSPDESHWFFCETKGPRDSVGAKQKKIAKKILKVTGERVMLLHLKPIF